MKTKHNKKRNTAFVYEALVKEATVAVLKKETDKHTKVVNIIKKYFSKDSILKRDLECYQSLYENQDLPESMCTGLIAESKFRKKMIASDQLFKKQSEMISDINKEISPEVFNNFVPNYKNLATISQIFSSRMNVKSQIVLESQLAAQMHIKPEDLLSESLANDDITYNIFLKKFNEKYDGALLKEQKELLSHYVSSFSDNALELKVFLNEEVGRLKAKLTEISQSGNNLTDTAMKEKTKMIIEKLENFSSCSVGEDVLVTIMKTQKLVEELNKNVNKD